MPTPTTTHTPRCRAYAIGCAVENLADAGTSSIDPVTTGEGYLLDGTVTCRCELAPSPNVQGENRTLILGLMVLTGAAR